MTPLDLLWWTLAAIPAWFILLFTAQLVRNTFIIKVRGDWLDQPDEEDQPEEEQVATDVLSRLRALQQRRDNGEN